MPSLSPAPCCVSAILSPAWFVCGGSALTNSNHKRGSGPAQCGVILRLRFKLFLEIYGGCVYQSSKDAEKTFDFEIEEADVDLLIKNRA